MPPWSRLSATERLVLWGLVREHGIQLSAGDAGSVDSLDRLDGRGARCDNSLRDQSPGELPVTLLPLVVSPLRGSHGLL